MSGLDLLLSQSVFLRMIAWAVLAGLTLGFVYDLLFLLRLSVGDPAASLRPRKGSKTALPEVPPEGIPTAPPEKQISAPRSVIIFYAVLRFLTDLAFACICSLGFILLCYYTNDGQIRAPAIFGMACGFFVWRVLPAHAVRRLGDVVIRAVRHLGATLLQWLGGLVLLAVTALILRPARLLGTLLWRVTVGRLLARRHAAATERRLGDLTRQAEKGFPPHE